MRVNLNLIKMTVNIKQYESNLTLSFFFFFFFEFVYSMVRFFKIK